MKLFENETIEEEQERCPPRARSRRCFPLHFAALLMSSRRVPDIYVGWANDVQKCSVCKSPVALGIRLAENAAELSHTSRGSRLAFANVNQICSNAMLPLNLDTLEFHQLVDRVRSEFLEMPGRATRRRRRDSGVSTGRRAKRSWMR